MSRLAEFFLPHLMWVFHKFEKMTQEELQAQKKFIAGLKTVQRKTKKPVVIAIIGLVGSGKTRVSRSLAPLISATIIEGDAIRVCLRETGAPFEGARRIAESAMLTSLEGGANVILDSDHIGVKKRSSLKEKLKETGARLLFVRTHCNFDTVAGRIITADFEPDGFFGGAGKKSSWQGKSKPAVVKLRELWRRTPNHYRWLSKAGGKWVLKKLPLKVFGEVDTTDPEKMEIMVDELAGKINSL